MSRGGSDPPPAPTKTAAGGQAEPALADFISPQRNYVGGFAVIAGVGKIGEDQAEDHAARKGWDAETAKRWLRPNLGG